MDKKELEFTTRLTREEVAGWIEALIEDLKDGRLEVRKSDEVLVLDVPRVIDLEVEASIDDEKAEVEVEISWRTNRAENPDLPPSGKTKAAPSPLAAAVDEDFDDEDDDDEEADFDDDPSPDDVAPAPPLGKAPAPRGGKRAGAAGAESGKNAAGAKGKSPAKGGKTGRAGGRGKKSS
jgi:amphi-Trp domain-containing protein